MHNLPVGQGLTWRKLDTVRVRRVELFVEVKVMSVRAHIPFFVFRCQFEDSRRIEFSRGRADRIEYG
jgi:hypothetical protein